ncbi:MAG TPA: oxidoreductase, partial [Planctomycetaceae bacterium]|nr:oxidoreductase [Planctomycetaceae bacterium]
KDTTYAHFKNWVEAMQANDQSKCNNPPDLGAAAIAVVNMGSNSYRNGKVYHFDADSHAITEGDGSWSKKWEAMSEARQKPKHIPGWKAGDKGSVLEEPSYMTLAGPWVDGKPPKNNPDTNAG